MRRNRVFLLSGLLVALVLACVVSYWASSSPDGLEKVAHDKKIDAKARNHHLNDSPLADYGTKGVSNQHVSTAIAGASGVLLTLAIGGGLFWLVRSRKPDDEDDQQLTGAGVTSP